MIPLHDQLILAPLVVLGLFGLGLVVTGLGLLWEQGRDQREADAAERAAINLYMAERGTSSGRRKAPKG